MPFVAKVMMQVTLDASGAMLPASLTDPVTRNAYTPYGAVRGADELTIDHGWLNKIADTDTGLTYLGARYFDSLVSRFISPDPLMNPMDPRTLDAYMYSNDNPVTYSDPGGMAACSGVSGAAEASCLTAYYKGMGLTPPKPSTTTTVAAPDRAKSAAAAAAATDKSIPHPSPGPTYYGPELPCTEMECNPFSWEWAANGVNIAVIGVGLAGECWFTAIETLGAGCVEGAGVASTEEVVVETALEDAYESELEREGSVWAQGALQRGVTIENTLGHNVPASYPKIDVWDSVSGTATSIKSINLNASTYQNPSAVLGKIRSYVRDVNSFDGNPTSRQLPIEEGATQHRVLLVAIPNGTSVSADIMDKVRTYATQLAPDGQEPVDVHYVRVG